MLDLPLWLRLFLAVFGIFKIVWFWLYEPGLFGFMDMIRTAAGRYDYDENLEPESNLGKMFICPFCLAPYAAIITLLLAIAPWSVAHIILIYYGITGAFIYLAKQRAWRMK